MAISVGVLIDPGGNLSVFENKIIDARHRYHNAPTEQTKKIIILDITEDSIKRLEPVYGRWPWPRSVHGEIIEYLKSDGASVVGFDILFPERSLRREIDAGIIDDLRSFALSADIPEVRSELIKRIESLKAEFSDGLFVSAVNKAGNVILPSVFTLNKNDLERFPELVQDEGNAEKIKKAISRSSILTGEGLPFQVFHNATIPFDSLSAAARGVGHINYTPDKDGVCRKFFPILFFRDRGRAYPAFPLLVASAYFMKSIRVFNDRIEIGNSVIPLFSDGSTFIRYQGGTVEADREDRDGYRSHYDFVPYDYVLASKDLIEAGNAPLLEKGFFRNKIVLVTASAAGLSDQRATPFSPVTPGIEIHANIIDNILSNRFMYRIGSLTEIFYILLLSGAVGILSYFTGPYLGALFSTALILSVSAVEWSIFREGYLLPIIKPLTAMTATYFGILLLKYVKEYRNRIFLKTAFGHYISSEVLEDILSSPEKLKLGGENRLMTVLFSDIEGFTSLSERMTPEETGAVLNEYLTAMVRCIKDNKGTLDKFIGDAVMAFWNAPLHQENHASLACDTALMMMKNLKSLTARWKDEGKSAIAIRIGINTGEMVVGNMGSKDIFDYTVLGSEVNTASRLEPLNKEFGTRIIVSESTKNDAGRFSPERFLFRNLGKVLLKGTATPLIVSELISLKEDAEQTVLTLVDDFERGLEMFQDGDRNNAGKCFESILMRFPDDGPSRVYLQLCDPHLNRTGTEAFPGVYVQRSK
ncbi:MAG: adenylate/guanylate cyclase domain-containing protein [Thermodesulfobacteriota bacterium]